MSNATQIIRKRLEAALKSLDELEAAEARLAAKETPEGIRQALADAYRAATPLDEQLKFAGQDAHSIARHYLVRACRRQV